MAYTTAQLVTLFTNANLGKAPDAATTLTLDAYATQSQTGGISDAVALGNTLKLLNSTTAVAISTYQFFTNRAPSAAGLDYLVDSTTNTNDLNDAYYAKFAQENRFINFAINLGTVGEGKTAFTTSYATVTYDQTIATAYDKIIGNTVAAAAGVNVPAALAYFGRAENITYLTAFVKANTSFTADADVTLAVKAALVGQILSAATSAGLGGYAAASTAMLTDLSDGTLATDNVAGVNILTAYPATGAVGTVQNLTTGIDTIVGTANNDTFNGTATAVAASSTVNLLDSVDGGLGADTLNISNAGAATDINLASLTVKNVETLNFTSVTGLNGGAVDVSGYTGLTQANISLAAPAAAQAVTAATSTGVALTVAGVGANNISTQGGGAVAVTATGQTTATINLGATTASTGVTSVTNTGVYADGADVTLGAITVKGGSTVSITQATGITAAQATAAAADATNFDLIQAAVTVTGTTATKSVSVAQAATVVQVDSTGTNGKIGVTAGAVTITDVNNALTTANTITSVSLTNGTNATINGSAVNSLTLNNAAGVVLTANLANVALSKALTLNLAGGTSGVTDTNNEITSLTVNATAASSFSFADTGLTTLAVSGATLATLTNANALTGLKTVTVTGAGGFTSSATTFNANSVTKVDTTGATGTSTVAIDGSGTAKTAFAGGAGIDIVTLVNALPAAGSVQLGAGNDRLLGATAVAVSTTTVLDGGDGVDAVAATLINAGNAAQFKGFETLNLNSAGNFDVALLTGSTIQTLELNGGPGGGTYGGLTTAQSTTVTGTSTGTVTLAFAAATGTADAYTIGFNAIAAATSTATARTAVNAGTVAVGAIEAVTLNSGAASGFTTNTIALTDAEARTLTVTGAQDLVLSFTTAFGTANATTGFSSLDASAATGAVSVNTANIGSLTAGFAVKTGTGADTVTVAATQFTTITTGAGKDTVVATASLGVQGAGATAAVYTTVADLASGDKITFVDTGAEVFTSTKVNVDAAANLGAALDLASAGAGNVNGIISWFQYGGNTYIVNDNGAGATFANGTDIVVKLTGLIDLSTATGNGTNSITLA